MDQPSFSFVVPVFNSVAYLRECLDSILQSARLDIELICIDDASTDGSGEILAAYQSRDPRLRVVRNEANQGISRSRNEGLRLARGEYVHFTDSDDWLADDFCARLTPLLAEGADVLCFNAVRHSHKGARPIYSTSIDMRGSGPEWMTARCKRGRYWDHSMWLFCYRRAFLTELSVSFPVLTQLPAISVDYPWNFRILLQARRVISISDCLYHYRVRENSTTTAQDGRHIQRRVISWSTYLAELAPLLDAAAIPEPQRRAIEGNLVERALAVLKYFGKLDQSEKGRIYPEIRPALNVLKRPLEPRHRIRTTFARLRLRLNGFGAD